MIVSQQLKEEVTTLLKALIKTPSYSREEDQSADLIQDFLKFHGISSSRLVNNIWVRNLYYDSSKPTILLNSHHDTVRPNEAYSMDPFEPVEKGGKIYGLGSNDAGASLVSLLATFLHFYDSPNLNYNLLFAATAEEEISGPNGMRMLFDQLGRIDFAIVGEPTGMQMAVAEKGLLVIDAYAYGPSGHAAHGTENSIYNAMKDTTWFREYTFQKKSEVLGPVHMQVTQISAGIQHNVMPTECHFVIDVRVNEHYTNEEVLGIIQEHTSSKMVARSVHLNSSGINVDHPIVVAGRKMGKQLYGSGTLSDQALIQAKSIKMGPGDTLRSHMADEYILRSEIEGAIHDYVVMLNDLLLDNNAVMSKKEKDETLG